MTGPIYDYLARLGGIQPSPWRRHLFLYIVILGTCIWERGPSTMS